MRPRKTALEALEELRAATGELGRALRREAPALARVFLTVWLTVALVAALMLLLASDGQARTLLRTAAGDSAYPYQAWVDQARVPTPDVEIRIHEEVQLCGRPVAGCAGADFIAVDRVYCQELGDQDRWCREITYHEVGHHFDRTMPEWKRRVFARILGLTGAWENPETRPIETFASAYAYCARGVWPAREGIEPEQSAYYLYAPTKRQHRRVCMLIKQGTGR